MNLISVLAVLAGLGTGAWVAFHAYKKQNLFGVVVGLLLAFVLALSLSQSFGQVPAGYRGVTLRFGAVTGEVKGEGLYFVTPFVNSVELMNTQVHAYKVPAAAASRDLQNVTTDITLNFRVSPSDAAKVYQNLRQDYEERIIAPSVQEAVKAATAQFDAEQLVTKRPVVRDLIESMLRDRLMHHGILLDQMSITNFAFSKDFADAIEAKVVATQQALKAENDLRRIQVEAEQTVATAKANAEAIRIQAQSIAQQGGANYVALQWIEAWKTGGAQVPSIITSDKAGMFLQIPQSNKKE